MMLSSSGSNPIAIAVDVDEVLAQFIPSLADFHNAKYGTSLTVESFTSYEFHKVWGGSAAECSMKMDAFFDSVYFQNLSPVPGAFEALSGLCEFPGLVSLHVVTARQNKLQAQTLAWLDKHYPGLFLSSQVHFGNHYSSNGERSRSKPEMCLAVGAVCLIDDSLVYAMQCAAVGLRVILFGDYGWNRGEGGALVTRANDWVEASALIRDVVSEFGAGAGAERRNFKLEPPPHVEFLLNPPPLTPPQHHKVAVIQLCSVNDKQRNLAKISELVQHACIAGAQLVCLPEACLFVGLDASETVANALTLTSPELIELCGLARKFQVWLSFCVAWRDDSPSQLASAAAAVVSNRHVLVDVLGEIVEFYDKIHLFDNPMLGIHESSFTQAGQDIRCHTRNPFGAIGLSICYDLRFPGLYSRLSSLGAQILLVPSAFTVITGQAHWEVLLRARAIENQAWVIASAQCGQHSSTRSSFGNSLVVDPWGVVVCRGGPADEGFLLFALDMSLVDDVRQKMPGARMARACCVLCSCLFSPSPLSFISALTLPSRPALPPPPPSFFSLLLSLSILHAVLSHRKPEFS